MRSERGGNGRTHTCTRRDAVAGFRVSSIDVEPPRYLPKMGIRFNPPPGWPKPPPGWFPPLGWTPDATWPPPPPGWKLYKPTGFPRWVVSLLILGVFGLGGVLYTFTQGQQESDQAPKVGECAKRAGADSVVRAPCGEADAIYRVTSRVEGTDSQDACADDPEATVAYTYSASSHGVALKSFVLCLTRH